MYDFTQDFTDYQKLVPNADLTVKPPSTGTTQPQGYDFNKDLEGYRKIAPDMSGLESVNDPLIKKAKLAQEKQTEEDKNKLQLAADLMITSGYSPDPEGVASAQITEGARKSLAGMQDRILGKSGVITQRFGNKNPIVLELGCGKGEYSVGLAARFPDKKRSGSPNAQVSNQLNMNKPKIKRCENL